MKKKKLEQIAKTLGIDPAWTLLWDETQKWYGDIKKKETPEQFLLRMQTKFLLMDRSKLTQL